MTPQASLDEFADPDLSDLSEAQREIVEATILGDQGVREYIREQDWNSPGTASKLLQRARQRVPELQEMEAGR